MEESAAHAIYDIEIDGQVYYLRIDRSGRGLCRDESTVRRNMQNEDPLMQVRTLFEEEKAISRLRHLEGEFSFDIHVPPETAALIWAGWDRCDPEDPATQVLTPEHTARYAAIDAELEPLIRGLL